MKMFGLRLTGRRKCSFLIFAFFHFSKFQITIVRNIMEKSSSFMIDFEGS